MQENKEEIASPLYKYLPYTYNYLLDIFQYSCAQSDIPPPTSKLLLVFRTPATVNGVCKILILILIITSFCCSKVLHIISVMHFSISISSCQQYLNVVFHRFITHFFHRSLLLLFSYNFFIIPLSWLVGYMIILFPI